MALKADFMKLNRRQFLQTLSLVGGSLASNNFGWPALIASAHRGIDPRIFQATQLGSGNFGEWVLDSQGLPAYSYQLDQYQDPIGRYPNSQNLDRRDHWHQVGNERITALASNDGTV